MTEINARRISTKERVSTDIVQAESAKLRALFEERAAGQTDFGEKHGIGTQGMVWQYLHGRRPLNMKAGVAFSHGLDVPLRSFSPRLADEFEQMQKKLAETDQVVEVKMSFTEAIHILNALSDEDREAWLKHGRLLVNSQPKGPNNPYGGDN